MEERHSEPSELLVLSAVNELPEAAEAEARRVGDSSAAGVEFSLGGPLNHEFPREIKSGGGWRAKETGKKGRNENRERKFPNGGVTNKVKSVALSHSALPGETKQSRQNTPKLSEVSVNFSVATEPTPGCEKKNNPGKSAGVNILEGFSLPQENY